MKPFENRTAMVTGAGRNMGKAIAMAFAEAGADVIVCDLNGAAVEQTCREIREKGVKAYPAVFDVRDRKTIFATVENLKAEGVSEDILVNNAGGSAALLHKLTDFASAEEETVDFVLDVNLKGSINCIQAVLPGMIERQWGRIINIASIAAVCGITQRADYSAAKAGLVGLSKALAMEVGPKNVTVNCVSPGAIEREGEEWTGGWTFIGENGRAGKPQEVADTVVFLASQSYITGQNWQVDGGRTLGPKHL